MDGGPTIGRMTSLVSPRRDDLLAARCATCRDTLADDMVIVNFGDLQFHLDCRPACSTCGRALRPGEGGWRLEGHVVSEPWGYSVQPETFWCAECLGTALRDAPKGSD
jgi:hypothetical protein